MNNQEVALLTVSKIPSSAGHTINKGTPRENFIENFLKSHLSERAAIGKGEIIDCNSIPNPPRGQGRPQIDIVIYKRDYPKLDFGADISAFLSESVVATIEVKSILGKSDIKQAIKAALYVKGLERNIIKSFSTGYQPPSILNFVIAYDGPDNLSKICNWIDEIHTEEGVTYPEWGSSKIMERQKIASPSLDGIFILGKGYVKFDNAPITFISDETRKKSPKGIWEIVTIEKGSLLALFIILTIAVSGLSVSWLNPLPYLKNLRIDSFKFHCKE